MSQRKAVVVELAEAMGVKLPREGMSANEILGLCIQHARSGGGAAKPIEVERTSKRPRRVVHRSRAAAGLEAEA